MHWTCTTPSAGLLRAPRHSSRSQVGFNKWETMEVLPMQRCEELAGNGAGGDWWQVGAGASRMF